MTTVDASLQSEFDALARGEVGSDRFALYARLRAERPIFFNSTVNAWVITRYDDSLKILTADEVFLPLTTGPGSAVYGRAFTQMHGVEHQKKVGIVGRRIRSSKAFSTGLGEVVRLAAQTRADALPFDEPVDLKSQFSTLVPLDILTHLFQIEQTSELRDIYDTIEHGGMASVADPEAQNHARQAIPRLKAYLAPILAERRKSPGDDLISDMVTATYQDELLPDDELVAMIAFLLIAGVKTTDRVLSCIFRQLLVNRPLWDEVRLNQDENSLMSFAAETLRLYPPAGGVTRQTESDFTIRDITIKKGDRVVVLVAASNRDPAQFDEPDSFQPQRFIKNPGRQFTSAATMLPFGAGPHFCVGVRLAGTELWESLKAIVERVDHLEPAGPTPDLGGFLHYGPPSVPVILRR